MRQWHEAGAGSPLGVQEHQRMGGLGGGRAGTNYSLQPAPEQEPPRPSRAWAASVLTPPPLQRSLRRHRAGIGSAIWGDPPQWSCSHGCCCPTPLLECCSSTLYEARPCLVTRPLKTCVGLLRRRGCRSILCYSFCHCYKAAAVPTNFPFLPFYWGGPRSPFVVGLRAAGGAGSVIPS